ncbi:MAG TPA: TraR/DksA C4-type zinc finger protein [Vicinamibacterales bacterium]|nr:TraR/DksA C4-type zinc finger protein [Vicinamibacterales bacterium]
MSSDVQLTQRDRALRRRLEQQREQLGRAARERMREAQQQNDIAAAGGLDLGDVSVNDVSEDLDFALLEIQTETMAKIDEALVRLGAGIYGVCVDCGGDIAARRLEALPFAIRCRSCEEHREAGATRPSAPPVRVSSRTSHADSVA